MSVAIGRKVPDFSAASTGGEVRLSKLKGRKLVLFFYPKDNTPGCTNEAGDFRDLHAAFAEAGALVLGVSRDSLKSHEGFKGKLGLPYELVSDPDEALCEQFGVMKLKTMYGRQVRGIERSTFVIDTAGKLAHEWRGVKVPGHVAEVLEVVRSIS
ncbi:MAG TPA: peroxiredoxin [Burkholderiaceae bacterium]|nr:peroxiredoxin [Burkholderiaceae bacterium]